MEPAGESREQTEKSEPEEMESEKKQPQRFIHFSNGDIMEEYSTEEESEEEHKVLERVDPSSLSWNHFLVFWVMKVARTSLFTCDFLGEKLANLFGLTSAKYQYAVDEYYSVRDQEECEDGDEMTVVEDVKMNERQHLPLQNFQYGTLDTVEQSGIASSEDCKYTVHYNNEAIEDNADTDDQIKMNSN
ncbi:protein FAM177B-like isoform X1 [Rhincodon typus]|uniref:protein FAM177B-like isoform X1 n=2 Tax=Rhincodon typus TaxID=259920 RepID=UPI0009A3F32B|nr:protein FAM177B-like isoform X1 [Rhincodon typus]